MLKVSFDFDEISQTVLNVKVEKKSAKYEDCKLPIVEVGDSKLILSPETIKLLLISYGDRIDVNYIQENNQTFPVIGKSEVFSDPNSGNKLLKTNTICFKGTQRNILLKYGNFFKLEKINDGIFKLISIDKSNLN